LLSNFLYLLTLLIDQNASAIQIFGLLLCVPSWSLIDLSIGIVSVTKIRSIKVSLLLEKCVGLTIKLTTSTIVFKKQIRPQSFKISKPAKQSKQYEKIR
jgi:hypothetical protein